MCACVCACACASVAARACVCVWVWCVQGVNVEPRVRIAVSEKVDGVDLVAHCCLSKHKASPFAAIISPKLGLHLSYSSVLWLYPVVAETAVACIWIHCLPLVAVCSK